MTNELKMSYEDMNAELTKLSQYATDFETTTGSMSTSVATLCDNWTAEASETYREDYNTLAANFSQTLEVVRALIDSTANYIVDMQATDEAYSGSKVVTS